MTSLLADGGDAGWVSRPLAEAPTADPWDYQERPRADGPSLQVLSSFPHGERRTGVLRSPDFPAGAQIQFWLSGHDGYPDQPAAGRNAVRLRDAADHNVLLQAAPPRNDTAQRVVWDTRPYAGRQVYLEVTDADPGDAYAWLALGGLEGAPALPTVTPRGRTELLLGAAELAGQLGVTPESPEYDSLRPLIAAMRDSNADLRLRAAAVRVLIPAFRAEAELFTDAQIPVTWRRRLADSTTSGDPELRKRFLSELRREAPQRVQSRIVRALVRDRAAVRELSFAIERGEIAPGILRDPGLRDFLLGLADEDSRARLETTLRTLPPVDASRSELLAERRRAFEASPGDRALGARLYEQNCAVCHQLNGQGGLVGPQLTGIGNRGAERLCEDILDPNQNVDHAFRQTRIELRNGDLLAGLFRREEGDLLVFADATGKEFNVRKGDVAEREESPVSLMPDNFAEVLPTAEFNHLLAFLLSQR
jgi:putative heme-binding domain-containing protein